MKSKKLAQRCGVHINTIRRLSFGGWISGYPVGGRHGWDLDEDAVQQVREALAERHRKGVRKRLKAIRNARAGVWQ